MKIGDIYLVKVNNKILPAVLLEITKNLILIVQIKPYTTHTQSGTFFIGQPEGLYSKSLAMFYRTHQISSVDIIKKVASLKEKKVKHMKQAYEVFLEEKRLHYRLHILKEEIKLAQTKNLDYSKLKKEQNKILVALGYKDPNIQSSKANKKSGKYANYRVLPSTGSIKVYPGGGCSPR